MHIIIAEKDTDGQKTLRRILKTDGYEVSIAETGNHVVGLLMEPHINIVLVNVFQYMYSSDAVPEQKLNIRKIKAANQALLVTCGISEKELGEFISPESLCHDPAFEISPATVKSSSVNRVLQLCSALRQSMRMSHPDEDLNWRRFSLLMDLPTDAYLGCRFLR